MASIINNIGAINAQRNLAKSQDGLNNTINRLSTGLRINRAYDDAAGLQISNNLRADVRILNQARRNAQDGLGRLAVVDLVSEEASNLLTRAAELAEQSASGTTTSTGRTALDAELTEIKAALDDLHDNTKFDGEQVFGTTGTTSVQVGETTGENVVLTKFGISSAALSVTQDLTTSDNALAALTEITSAIESVSASRGTVGAKSQRLFTLSNSLGINAENIQAAESQIRDADVAAEVVNLTKFQILSQSGVSALAQANQSAQSVLGLLG
jgi:flagellin